MWQVYCSHIANSLATRVRVYNDGCSTLAPRWFLNRPVLANSLHRPATTRRCLHKVCTKIAQGRNNIGTWLAEGRWLPVNNAQVHRYNNCESSSSQQLARDCEFRQVAATCNGVGYYVTAPLHALSPSKQSVGYMFTQRWLRSVPGGQFETIRANESSKVSRTLDLC